MKSPRTPLKAELQRVVREAEEAMAAVLLEPNALRSALLAAAGEGHQLHVVAVSKALDMRETAAGKAAEAHLKREGLAWEWRSRTIVAADGVNSGQAWELIVRWDDGRIKPT